MRLKTERPIVFFDLETTGTDKTKDRIVSIAMIKYYEDGTRTETLNHLCNPERFIPKQATAIHGITDEMVANQPYFRDIANEVLGFIQGCDLAGFNSNSFDAPILYNEFGRTGIEWDYTKHRFIDVGNLFKILNPRTLEAAYKHYIGAAFVSHDAVNDTEATIAVLAEMLDLHPDLPDDIDELAKYSNFGRKMLDMSGYLIYNEDGKIVFNFGKNRGKVVSECQDYARWVVENDFPPDMINIVKKIFKWR